MQEMLALNLGDYRTPQQTNPMDITRDTAEQRQADGGAQEPGASERLHGYSGLASASTATESQFAASILLLLHCCTLAQAAPACLNLRSCICANVAQLAEGRSAECEHCNW
jgi:hypothetical protein